MEFELEFSASMDTEAGFESFPAVQFPNSNFLPSLAPKQIVKSSLQSNDPDYVLHIRDNKNNGIAAATSSKVIKIYDSNLSHLNTIGSSDLRLHSQVITDMCFIPNQPNVIASCSEDGTLVISDIRTGSMNTVYKEPNGNSFYCCASNGEILAAGGECTETSGISFWDLRMNSLLGCFSEVSPLDILQLQFSATESSKMFSGGEDGIIIEFNMLATDQDEAFESAYNIEQSVGRFGFFDNGSFMYCISQVNTLSIWNTDSGECVANFDKSKLAETIPIDYMIDCFYDSSRLYLASGTNRGTILLSSVSTGLEPIQLLSNVHQAPVRHILWNNNSIYSCGEDSTISLWSSESVQAKSSHIMRSAPTIKKNSPYGKY